MSLLWSMPEDRLWSVALLFATIPVASAQRAFDAPDQAARALADAAKAENFRLEQCIYSLMILSYNFRFASVDWLHLKTAR